MKTKLSLYLLLLVLVLSACQVTPLETETPPSIVETSEPIPTEEPLPPQGQPFTSEKFGFSIEYPQGWLKKDRPGEWQVFQPLDPNRTGGIDAFAAYQDGRNLTFGIAARDLAEGETLASWEQTVRTQIMNAASMGVCYESGEDEPVTLDSIQLDGEPAVYLEYTCPNEHDSYGLVVLALHNGKGYWITWIAPQGNAKGDQETFLAILNTFRFHE